MTKPLDLTVYPLMPKVGRRAELGYVVNRRAVPLWTLQYSNRAKRLTDTELAAEYWAAALDAGLMAPANLVAIAATVHRFATHNHYDEES